jgi:hypothetical protein
MRRTSWAWHWMPAFAESLRMPQVRFLPANGRPSDIPSDALWVGGADGGAYVRCTVDAVPDANPCSVWNDYTGHLVESGEYRLLAQKRAAKESELSVAYPDFGGLIYLQKGLILKRLPVDAPLR